MDCKLEHASRTLVRIEAIEAQGIVRNFLTFPMMVLMIPITPFLITRHRYMEEKDKLSWLKMILFIPCWFVFSILIAFTIPFQFIADSVLSLWMVAKFEWNTRWAASNPKKPNGEPIAPFEMMDKRQIDETVFESIVKDYPEEAETYLNG